MGGVPAFTLGRFPKAWRRLNMGFVLEGILRIYCFESRRKQSEIENIKP